MRFHLLLLFLYSACSLTLNLHKFSPESVNQTGAVCNDGSPGAYYLYQGNVNKWLIYFNGGALCFTAQTCAPRNGTGLASSNGYLPTATNRLPEHPMFANWSRVEIPYCSSDIYSGQKRVPSDFGFIFAGHLIVKAIFDDLITNYGMDNNSEILLWGDSAGAVGVIGNVDYVGYLLPGARVQAVANSGWFLNHTLFSQNGITIDQLTPLTTALYQPRGNTKCLSQNPKGLCGYIVTAYPYIDQKIYWAQSFIDSYEIGVQLGFNNPTDPNAFPFLIDVGTTYKNALAQLQSKPGDAWYLVTCYVHVPSVTIPYVGGLTIMDGVVNWYFGLNGSSRIADNCNLGNATLQQFLNANIPCYNVTNTCVRDSFALPPLTSGTSNNAVTSGTSNGAISSSNGAISSSNGAISSNSNGGISSSSTVGSTKTQGLNSAPSLVVGGILGLLLVNLCLI